MQKCYTLQNKFIISIFIIIIPTLSLIFTWAGYQHEKFAIKQLVGKARVLATQIILTRKWVSHHGGVLIKERHTPEEKKFLLKDRINTDRGSYLRITPSMVTRELSTESMKQDLYWFRLFSSCPINPENYPGDFEKAGLELFESGDTKELHQFSTFNGNKYFQFIVPLRLDKTCLGCHQKMGVKGSEIYGGLSVFFPIRNGGSYLKINHSQLAVAGIGILILITLTLFFLLKKVVIRPLQDFEKMAEAIGKGDYTARVNVHTGDEFEALGQSFNMMGKKLLTHNSQMTEKINEATGELSRANQELKTLDTLKSDFLANMSHELRSPLTVIRGGMDYLNRTDTNQSSRDHLDVMNKNLNRLIHLVSDIFDFTKLESSNTDWQFEIENLSELVHDTVYILGPIAANKNIAFKFNPDEDVFGDIDLERFEQVLVNLLDNAIKFSEKDTQIEIRVDHTESMKPRIRIRDYGPGIPAEKLETIFEKFQTLPSSGGGSRPAGTGLGLAICKKIIEAHKGQIWAENANGCGSIFVIEIPEV